MAQEEVRIRESMAKLQKKEPRKSIAGFKQRDPQETKVRIINIWVETFKSLCLICLKVNYTLIRTLMTVHRHRLVI